MQVICNWENLNVILYMNLNELFKEKKIKLTQPRKVVAEILIKAGKPISLDELHSQCSKIDFSSVFRNVRLFESLGLVEEINFGDKKPRYEFLLNTKHHHHIRCKECGKIERIDNICLVNQVKKETNYHITHHVIE